MDHTPRSTLFVWLVFLTNVTCLEYAFASSGPGEPLKTKYSSRSGQFLLHIVLNNPEGQGVAEYQMFKDGREVWHRTLPITLCNVCVLDDGVVAGYGYSHGLEGYDRESPDEHGDLVVTILDPQGGVRVKEAYHRSFGPFVISGQVPEPLADAIIVDVDNDRIVFLVTYNPFQLFEPFDTAWRQFQLSTGRTLGIFYPEKQMKDAKWLRACNRAQPLPGTPLLLAQWWRCEGIISLENPPIWGTHFALLDEKCHPVWQLTLRDDYDIREDKDREKQLSAWVKEHSAILSMKAPGQFDLYYAKAGQRVSFEAKQDGRGTWTVTELGCTKYTPRIEKPGHDQNGSRKRGTGTKTGDTKTRKLILRK